MASTSPEKIQKPFFKIIADDSMYQQKLGIPCNFVRNYGDDLSSPVTLKVPGGSEWKVEIVKSEGEIWLGNGWREFAEYYSVVEGSFLVFEYQKTSCEFNVIIFDKTAPEKNHPLTSFDNGDQEIARDLDQEQVPQEPHKNVINLESSEETLDQSRLTGNSKESIEKGSRHKEQKPRKAKDATKKFTSANPSFRAKISSSCLKNSMVRLPYGLTRKIEPGTESVRLQFNNRCWSVKLIHYSEKKSYLSTGWAVFARENTLEVGDVCTFQLVSNTDETPLVNVSVIRRSDNGVDRDTEPQVAKVAAKNESRKERKHREKKEATIKFTSANPSFQTKIPPACVESGRVYVPYNSITRNIKPGTESVMLKFNNRCWSVKLIRYSEKTSYLSAGWPAFVRENSLKVGDVCTFELIHNTDQTPLFNISVIRDSDICSVSNGVDRETEQTTSEIPDEVVSGQFVSSRKRKEKPTLSSVNSQPRKKTKRAENLTKKEGKGKSEQSMRKESGTREGRCVGKPSFSNPPQTSASGNPFFQVVMKSSHLRQRGYNMNVPLHFIKNLHLGTRVARLQVGNRVWSVKLIIYPHFAKSVFSGWTRFAMDNALEVGDVCSFEMIDPQKLEIKVSISRDSSDVEFTSE